MNLMRIVRKECGVMNRRRQVFEVSVDANLKMKNKKKHSRRFYIRKTAYLLPLASLECLIRKLIHCC